VYNGVRWGWGNIFVSAANIAGLAQAFEADIHSVAALGAAFDIDLNDLVTLEQLQVIDREFMQDFAAAVPEPTTLLLFSTGVVGLLGYTWQRRQQR